MRRSAVFSVFTSALLASAILDSSSCTLSAASPGIDAIKTTDLREWLTYIASDELEGRGTYTAGLGLAAGYIQQHLRQWGVTPAGDAGSYIQTARVLGVKAKSRSSVTVTVRGQSRTFKDGEGVTFPAFQGAPRSMTLDRVHFAGYGLHAPGAGQDDFRGRTVRGAAVVFMGGRGPENVDLQQYRRVIGGRGRHATEQLGAAFSVGPAAESAQAARTAETLPASDTRPDFTTAQRLDRPVAPSITASDDFFKFVFSRAPVEYDELKPKADGRAPLSPFDLDDVTLAFTVDVDYTVVRTQFTQNIVGIVEGSDPVLRSGYVALGAHYDHVGYADAEVTTDGSRRPASPGRVTAGAINDRIWNGADDDGSGTVALMALAKAFAQGQRPRRSLLFVWHAGEERGLLGSRYFADYPTVPIDQIVAQLNLDMIGRNRDDKAEEANTVYVVGSDRISTELHEIHREANASLPKALTLDYEMNDPSDAEQVYYRSDHYSYAAKGIPIIFLTTGLHPDYHANTDDVSKIEFDKLTRVAQLVYETAVRLGNRDRAPLRDNQGARAGKGTK